MIYEGTAVSDGAAIGKVFHYKPVKLEINERQIEEMQAEQEIEKYQSILERAEAELISLMENADLAEEQRKIFQAHIDIVQDEEMNLEIEDEIRENLLAPECAVTEVYGRYIEILSKAKDDLIRERAADLKDVSQRIIRLLLGVEENSLENLPGEVILVAHDLLPSDTAAMKREYVQAIVT